MKINKLIGLFLGLSLVSYAQELKPEKLKSIAEECHQNFEETQSIIKKVYPEFVSEKGLTPEGYYFKGIDKGIPKFIAVVDENQLLNSNVDLIHSSGNPALKAEGENMIIYQWDGGSVRTTHQEFGSRITNLEPAPQTINNHATFVAGIQIASGVNPDAKGMAPKATLKTYDFSDNLAEIANESALPENQQYMLSNHSYGILTGWVNTTLDPEIGPAWHWIGRPDISDQESHFFGLYIDEDALLDEIAYNAPQHLIVRAAGNDRDDVPPSNPIMHYVLDENDEWVESNEARPQDCGVTGFDCLPMGLIGKNVLLVGSVLPLTTANGRYSNPSDLVSSPFSSFGPTDDGRIKPDLVAIGSSVISSRSSSDTAYSPGSNGTSFSAPSVTGIAALLQEIYQKNTGQYLDSSSLKAILINTALEAGNSPGPDYGFGFGLVNALDAATYLLNLGTNSDLKNETLNDSEEISYTFQATAEEVKLTIVWLDPAGEGRTLEFNNRTPVLVNDLDLRITDSVTDEVYMPWVLNPLNPSAAASRADNAIDNVEQVVIENAVVGRNYTVTINHKNTLTNDPSGTLSGGTQNFSLAVNNAVLNTLDTSEVSSNSADLILFPNPVSDVLNIQSDSIIETIQIIDLSGKVVSIEDVNDTDNRLSISHLSPGTYLLLAITDSGIQHRKFIKE